MPYDIDLFRAQFPALATGTAFFDGPGGTQTPRAVIEAMASALAGPLSNRGHGNPAERNAETIVAEARQALGDLLGADPRGIVFGRSATQLAYDFSRTLAKSWSPGDEIVVTRLDHDSNIRPWTQAAEQAGATVRWAEFDPEDGELTAGAIAAVLSSRTRLVAVTGASNLIGTRPPVPEISRLVHEAGALLYVDGVHLTAHSHIGLEELGADFFACSPYKFLGPHMGVLAARPGLLETLTPDKLLASTDAVPERFEFGTLPYELLAGARAAVDVIAHLGVHPERNRREQIAAAFAVLEKHEETLLGRIEKGLASLPSVRVHSLAAVRTPTLLLTLDGHNTAHAAAHLAERGINAPSGSFYAIEASRHLGLGDGGGLRVGLAPYNNTEDVDRLLEGLADFLHQGA
ncbi:cysteine desulfurase [Streptomyces abyssalis]|uniref:Cysteine desulfurase n=1 Tax=Streptomyces abyssalis TaxID=933944 RepID=A0A1E7JKQ4_9ACTN|nr:cysteine desulfurase-like protein [Streptomyces abyssalis]OEU88223.1 cysteine desulfurase [Streptomyces abyssalis]OEU91094.1 cysteine desulfurase [Streptomyces abyssalis]